MRLRRDKYDSPSQLNTNFYDARMTGDRCLIHRLSQRWASAGLCQPFRDSYIYELFDLRAEFARSFPQDQKMNTMIATAFRVDTTQESLRDDVKTIYVMESLTLKMYKRNVGGSLSRMDSRKKGFGRVFAPPLRDPRNRNQKSPGRIS